MSESDWIDWPEDEPLPKCGEAIDPRRLGICLVEGTQQIELSDGRARARLRRVRVRFFLPFEPT